MEITKRTVVRADGYNGESVQLSAVGTNDRRFTVDVFGPRIEYGSLRSSQVNWAGCGSVDVGDAAIYAALLAEAVRIAPTLSGPVTQ